MRKVGEKTDKNLSKEDPFKKGFYLTYSKEMTKYNEYLKSKYWISRRIQFRSKTWNRCFICRNKNNLEVHHKRYLRNNKSILFNEKHNDLRLLCRRCHEFIHKNGWVELFTEGKIKRRDLRDLILGVHNSVDLI